MPDSQIHRYELMEERRSADRRAEERRGARGGPGRRFGERRNGGSLAEAEAVRRIFPIAEGGTPSWVRRRERRQRGALSSPTSWPSRRCLPGWRCLTPVRTPVSGVLVGGVAAVIARASSAGSTTATRWSCAARRSTRHRAWLRWRGSSRSRAGRVRVTAEPGGRDHRVGHADAGAARRARLRAHAVAPAAAARSAASRSATPPSPSTCGARSPTAARTPSWSPRSRSRRISAPTRSAEPKGCARSSRASGSTAWCSRRSPPTPPTRSSSCGSPSSRACG